MNAQDPASARRLASWHLVSRTNTKLKGALVVVVIIESVAESASDGIMASF